MNVSIPSLLLLIPFSGGALALLLGIFRLRLTTGLTVSLALAGGLGLALKGAWLIASRGGAHAGELVAGGWLPGVGIVLRYDGLAAVMAAVLFLIALLILLHAIAEGERRPVFFGVYAIAVGGMVGVVLSGDLFNLFVFFEVLSLSAAILIAYERTLPAMQAAFRYLLVSTLSISLYLLGLFVLYRLTGELSFTAVASHLRGAGSGGPWRLAMVLLFAAVATRVALVPFHGWLPEAHGYAPTAVSALLSGLMLKAGFVAFWHLLQIFPGSFRLELLAWAGAVSALVGAGAALFQEDAKRLLAYSSVSQLGYIAAAAGAGAFAASFYHLLSHAFYKSLLFLIVGGWVHHWGRRSIEAIREKRGETPPVGAARFESVLLLLAVGAIVGLPPLSAFVSKGLMGELMKGSPVYLLIEITSFLTAAALMKLGLLAFPGARRRDVAGEMAEAGSSPSGEKSLTVGRGAEILGLLLLMLLFLPSIGLGILPGPVTRLLSRLGVIDGGVIAGVGMRTLYTPSRLIDAVVPVAVGAAVLLLLRTSAGRRLRSVSARLRLGVDGAMALMAVGVALIFGIAFLL